MVGFNDEIINNLKKYGIKLYNDLDQEVTFIWETENEEFNNRFNNILHEFLHEKKGTIQVNNEIFECTINKEKKNE